MFIFQNLRLDDYPLKDIEPETEFERWIVDRIVRNLTENLSQNLLREEIYAIAVGWESACLYLEGSFNTETAWKRKKPEIGGDPYWGSKWHTHLWTTLDDTFFVFGGLDDESDASWNWSRDGRDSIPWRIRLWGLTVSAILKFRSSAIEDNIRKNVPVICHFPIDHDLGWQATRYANPDGQADEYLQILDTGPAL